MVLVFMKVIVWVIKFFIYCRMVFGYAYPAYECYKTVEKNKPEIEQLLFWCQYWYTHIWYIYYVINYDSFNFNFQLKYWITFDVGFVGYWLLCLLCWRYLGMLYFHGKQFASITFYWSLFVTMYHICKSRRCDSFVWESPMWSVS